MVVGRVHRAMRELGSAAREGLWPLGGVCFRRPLLDAGVVDFFAIYYTSISTTSANSLPMRTRLSNHIRYLLELSCLRAS